MIIFVALIVLITIISLTLCVIIHDQQECKININPPGPQGLPFIGNLLQFDKSKPHIYLWQLSQKYGPLVYLKHGSVPVLVVSSANMAKQILKTHDLSFCSRPPVFGQRKLSYGGIDMAFSPYNHHWKEMRKICVHHLLSPKQVLSFRPIREDEVSQMISKISRLSSSLQPANLSDIAMSLAGNLICRVAFGKRYDDDEYEKISFDRLIMEAQALMVSSYFSDHFPGFGWLDKVSGLLDRLEKNCKELDVFYHQLIEEHLNPSRPKPDRQDIIDLMIQLKQQNLHDLTWDHIKALLMNLFVAGTDTVAAAVVWTMTGLMLRPAVMKKAQTEIRAAIGEKGTVDEDDIKKFPYLKAMVLESLRLYPPAPLVFRTQILDQECTVEGYKIKPGTSVFINGWAIARDPETWEDDPNEFLPERFMKGRNDNWVFDQFEMIPFGGGRRGCPGLGMGLISIELALANLLYSFDWALPGGTMPGDVDTDALPGLTMHKKNALVLLPTKYICP
ncbi:Cytochrome P450 CYP2 subfamily [Handroanthus impetiginosus]|uniref:Cytochrome P450 CYP2 subfamily n=1 Tax=Handroanthus impetiginosus TaxID=429701 RepID=A0A2G9HS75_9LAMI|nr:Cytochrome P450 CYP2 subfamily [Handroanthus impetiginosus]